MSSDPPHPPAGYAGVLRLPLDQRPRNHHEDPVAPLTPDGRPYRLRWTDTDRGEYVYAETAADLLGDWIPDTATPTPPAAPCSAPSTPSKSVTAWSPRSSLTPTATVSSSLRRTRRSLLADLDQMPHIARTMSHQASEKFRAVRITVAGVVEEISLDGAQLLQSLYAQIGCQYVEVVQPTDSICLWVDDEGLMNRAEPNLVASFLAAALGIFGQVLHGAVVVTGGVTGRGNTLPLSDRDLRILETIIDRLRSWTETRCRP